MISRISFGSSECATYYRIYQFKGPSSLPEIAKEGVDRAENVCKQYDLEYSRIRKPNYDVLETRVTDVTDAAMIEGALKGDPGSIVPHVKAVLSEWNNKSAQAMYAQLDEEDRSYFEYRGRGEQVNTKDRFEKSREYQPIG